MDHSLVFSLSAPYWLLRGGAVVNHVAFFVSLALSLFQFKPGHEIQFVDSFIYFSHRISKQTLFVRCKLSHESWAAVSQPRLYTISLHRVNLRNEKTNNRNCVQTSEFDRLASTGRRHDRLMRKINKITNAGGGGMKQWALLLIHAGKD